MCAMGGREWRSKLSSSLARLFYQAQLEPYRDLLTVLSLAKKLTKIELNFSFFSGLVLKERKLLNC